MTTQYLTQNPRSFPVAVGERLAARAVRTPLQDQSAWDLLNRALALLVPAGKLAFHAELRRLRGQ